MSFSMWLALVVFLAAVLMVASKRFHKAVVAIAGGAICMAAGLVSSDIAVQDINWKAVFLLVGMTITVSIVKRTGLFQFLAIRTAKAVKGNPIGILVVSSIIATGISMLFGPVLTLTIFAPVSILIAIELGVSPLPFLISQVVCANAGGMMTIVGDPVAVLIGTDSGLSFLDFLTNNGLVGIVVVLVSIGLLVLAFRNQLGISNERRARIMDFDESRSIQDRGVLIKALIVVAIMIAGFIVAPITKIEPFVIAIAGAVLLLIMTMRRNLEEVLNEIDWSTILFLVGFFIMVMSLQAQGVTHILTLWLIDLTHGDLTAISLIILWSSAIASAFIDTVPLVVGLIPMVQSMAYTFGPDAVAPVWWALSLGAVLGGNATLLGAPANQAVASISGKSGYPVSFATFTRYSAPVTTIGLIIASFYIVFRYFVLKV